MVDRLGPLEKLDSQDGFKCRRYLVVFAGLTDAEAMDLSAESAYRYASAAVSAVRAEIAENGDPGYVPPGDVIRNKIGYAKNGQPDVDTSAPVGQTGPPEPVVDFSELAERLMEGLNEGDVVIDDPDSELPEGIGQAVYVDPPDTANPNGGQGPKPAGRRYNSYIAPLATLVGLSGLIAGVYYSSQVQPAGSIATVPAERPEQPTRQPSAPLTPQKGFRPLGRQATKEELGRAEVYTDFKMNLRWEKRKEDKERILIDVLSEEFWAVRLTIDGRDTGAYLTEGIGVRFIEIPQSVDGRTPEIRLDLYVSYRD